jgi:hypothetical protein
LHNDSWGTRLVVNLGMGDSIAHPRGSTPPVQEGDSAAGSSTTGNSSLMLLLPVCHHVEVLDMVVAPKKEINGVIGFAAPIGQTH